MLNLSALPRLALSVRQPWTWSIMAAGKDIENRGWRSDNPNIRHRGRVALQAARGLTQAEYADAREFMAALGVACPAARDLARGGIIGTVEIVGVVRQSESRWFVGPVGLVLKEPRPCAFVPCFGELGFFTWRPAAASTVPEPARWMNPPPPKPAEPTTPDLFAR